eukprot:Skav220800  [mRNA]  locus=scaffold150:373141:374376:+ [translate_table: standard]
MPCRALQQERVTSAVSKLDNVYLTADAAKSAPEGSTPIVLTDVVRPVAGQMKEAGKEAVLAFTGKEDGKGGRGWRWDGGGMAVADVEVAGRCGGRGEDYKFGDISKEAAKRAKNAMANLLGQARCWGLTSVEEYQFGDVTKKAMGKAMDAINTFTGKEAPLSCGCGCN